MVRLFIHTVCRFLILNTLKIYHPDNSLSNEYSVQTHLTIYNKYLSKVFECCLNKKSETFILDFEYYQHSEAWFLF